MGPRKSRVEEVNPRTTTIRRDGQPSGPQRVGGRSDCSSLPAGGEVDVLKRILPHCGRGVGEP